MTSYYSTRRFDEKVVVQHHCSTSKRLPISHSAIDLFSDQYVQLRTSLHHDFDILMQRQTHDQITVCWLHLVNTYTSASVNFIIERLASFWLQKLPEILRITCDGGLVSEEVGITDGEQVCFRMWSKTKEIKERLSQENVKWKWRTWMSAPAFTQRRFGAVQLEQFNYKLCHLRCRSGANTVINQKTCLSWSSHMLTALQFIQTWLQPLL